MMVGKQLLLFCIVLFCAVAGFAQSHTFTVQNPADSERKNALVCLSKAQTEEHVGKITKDTHIEILFGNKPLSLQYIDSAEEKGDILFLADFKPKEKKVFTIRKVQNTKGVQPGSGTVRAHVRMKPILPDSSFGESVMQIDMPYQNKPTDFSKYRLPPYLTEGPGWENDKIAFRLYFDTRNTIDIYGKRVPGMVMDTVGANPNNSYHNLSGWGMDILHVVKSLGAGSLAIQTKDENGKDTLLRLGGNNITAESYRQTADGPLYASFEMDYEWTINNKPVHIKQNISIWGGQYFYESKITVTGAPTGAKLVSGIADFYENTVDSFHIGNAAVLFSFGKQSENKDELGMAIMMPQSSYSFFSEAPKQNSDVMETHLAAQRIEDGEPLTFRFYVGWSKTDPQFGSAPGFTSFLKREATLFSEPLRIRWKQVKKI